MRIAGLVLALFLFAAPALAGDVSFSPGSEVDSNNNTTPAPAVPEPGAALLMGLGLLTVGAVTRARKGR